MFLRAAVVEDNKQFREELVEKINSCAGITVKYATGDGEDFLKYVAKIKPEVVFLDIDLPGISGIEVAQFVRQQLSDTEIIFITSYDSYRREAIELYAADYITKPIDTKRLNNTINRLKKKIQLPERQLELKCDENKVLVRLSQVVFFEAHQKKTKVCTTSDEFIADVSFKELENMIDLEYFSKTGRSYIVNTSKVKAITKATRKSYEILFAGTENKAYLSKNCYQEFRAKVKELNR